MKIKLVLLAILAFPALVCAQSRQVGGSVVFSPASPGTADGASVGVRADVLTPVLPADDWRRNFLWLAAELSWAHEPKELPGLGDGSSLRARAEIRGQYPLLNYAPFVGVGVAAVRRSTSQYTKSAVHPTVSVGVVILDSYVPYYRHLFQERQTQNKARADEFGFDLYLPLDHPHLRARGGIALQNTRFYQPFGPDAGNHSAFASRFYGGIGWAW